MYWKTSWIIERNYEMIQNQTINKQESTQAERCVLENQLDNRKKLQADSESSYKQTTVNTGRTLCTGKPAGQSKETIS